MKGFSIIEDTDALKIEVIFAVLYGLPGVGKTSASFTMPRPILHLDADNGLHRAVQKIRPKSAKITEYGGFYEFVMSDEFVAYIRENEIKTVVIDTVGTLLDNLIAPYLIKNDPKNGNNTGGLSLQGWGALKNNFNSLKARLQSLGLHVCCVCHAKEEGESNSRRFELAVSGGSTEVIYRTADLIGLVTVQGDRRIVNFNPTNGNIGKNVGNLPAFNIPNSDSDQYDGFMAGVIAQAIQNMAAGSVAQVEFNKSLDTWRDILGTRNTPADFDKFLADALALPEGLLKATVRRLLADRLVEKELKFDKDSGKIVYINPPAEEPKGKRKAEKVTADEEN